MAEQDENMQNITPNAESAEAAAPRQSLQLTDEQQLALKKLLEMTPEQRVEFRRKIDELPPENRAAAEETLQLVAIAVQRAKERRMATQQLEKAALHNALEAARQETASPETIRTFAQDAKKPDKKADRLAQKKAAQDASLAKAAAKKAEKAEHAANKAKAKKAQKESPSEKTAFKAEQGAPVQPPLQAAAIAAPEQPLAVVPFTPKGARKIVAQQFKAQRAKAQAYLEQLVESFQRGANDGALAQARETTVLPLRMVYNALGQMLYSVGLQTEYMLLRIVRGLRSTARLLARTAGALVLAAIRPLHSLVRAIGRDISEPFVRIFSGLFSLVRLMRTARSDGNSPWAIAGAHLKSGALTYRKAALGALSYLLPAAAAGVFALTVWVVMSNDYSLSVEYNGEFLGYVQNETVWEDAQKMVRSRIRTVETEIDSETLISYPKLTVQSVNVAARTSAGELADNIIEASADQIKNATGLYVGEDLVGVCEDGKGVQRMLDSALASRMEAGNDAVRTEFVQDVHTTPGVYLAETVTSLAQVESDAVVHNWLQVKVIRTETYTELLPYTTVEQESDQYYTGVKRVQQKGRDGSRQVTAEVGYIDDVLVTRTELSSAVLEEPTPKIVVLGTKKIPGMYNGPIQAGTGAMIWPVPDYRSITTRFGQSRHRGIDITAPLGTPVYACDGGTVIEAGWHGSWGNYIKIDHGNGMQTLYAHNSALLVTVGQNVSLGQVIAQIGSTGNSSGNHCHLEMYVGGGLTDPFNYISPP